MERFLIWASISLLIWGMALAGLIVFGTSNPPPTAAAITGPFAHIDDRNFPELRRYQARDGAQLSYREYAASGHQVALLIHGSAGSSQDMHPLAVALQGRGVTVLVPDLRGHGANRPHGDISYVGQLDDDLGDLVAKKKPELPDTVWTAVGLSSGGGFALRVAAEFPIGKEFDRYILVSPYLKYNAPSVRQAASGTKPDASGSAAAATQSWAAVSTGRIIGLTILNFVGVHFWDGLPVIAFPVPAGMDSVTGTYSWRLQRNFGAHEDYLADIRGAARPVQVFVGGADELLDAEKLRTEFQSQRRDVPVTILPGLGHSDMVIHGEAIRTIAAAFP